MDKIIQNQIIIVLSLKVLIKEDKAVQSLESYTKGVINKLSQRVEKEVADYSNYVPASIEERFGKKLPNITYAQELILRVRPLPKELKDTTAKL